jgi:sphinganine-1-phosphate aldolase
MSTSRKSLPANGRPLAEIQAQLSSVNVDRVRGHWGRAFRGPADVQEVGQSAFNLFLSDNGLMSMRLDWMGHIESELTQMCVSLFHPADDAAATLTSGGSESIYSALHAMREWAREKLPHIKEPEVVAPYSAHPAFSKGCHYFGLRLRRVPLGADLRANPSAMEDALSPNTIGLVASAPCWPYAFFDPVDDIAAIAAKRGLWMHVDACVGGYLAPFLEQLGYSFPVWDFRAPGVMSISADLHKFGYCPKPASTILWRSQELLKYHHVHPSDWPGGAYKTTGFAGSRTAGAIFAAWAVMQYLGHDGYRKLAGQLMDTKARLVNGIDRIEGLRAWKNDLCPVAFESTGVDLTVIKAEMSRLGWALVGCAEPPLINIPLDAATDEQIVATFLEDLETVMRSARRGETASREALQY